MKSICYFSSHFEQHNIPYYAKCYLSELAKHFTSVIFIHSKNVLLPADMAFLQEKSILQLPVKNEGFDFGMWYKAMNKYPLANYERCAFVNDSCILFKSLDSVLQTINTNNWDYCGVLDSIQIAYHIQSYFIVINKKALPKVEAYFKQHGLMHNFDDLIKIYEVGLSQYLMQHNLKVGAVFSYKVCAAELNPSFSGLEKLIIKGFPMIKRKIIFGNYRKGEARELSRVNFNFNPDYYIGLIKKSNTNLILNFESMQKDYNYNAINFKLKCINFFSKSIQLIKKLIR